MTGPTAPTWTGGGRPASPPAGDVPARLGRHMVLVGFVLVLGAILLFAALGAILDHPAPTPDCVPGTACGGPPPGVGHPSPAAVPVATPTPSPTATISPVIPAGTVGIRLGVPRTNAKLGYEFEYSDWWVISVADSSPNDSSPDETYFIYQGTSGDALLIVAVVPASVAGPQAYTDQWFGRLKNIAPDLKIDGGPKDAIRGAEIGFVEGTGLTYAGSQTSPQGGTTPIGVSLVVASDGRLTAALALVVWNPEAACDTKCIDKNKWVQYDIRSKAEIFLKTFRWGPLP